jgi:prevent-host-death family protein
MRLTQIRTRYTCDHTTVTTTPARDAHVGIRDLKARLSHHLDRVKAGRTLVVTERGRVIAKLVPAALSEEPLPPSVERLLSSGAASWSGERLPDFEPIAARPGPTTAKTVAQTVSEDRR